MPETSMHKEYNKNYSTSLMKDFELFASIEIQIIVNYNFWPLSPL